jgi:hypothetical protein
MDMPRLTTSRFERAARLLAQIRDLNPDELTFYGGKEANAKRPRWVSLAEELRAQYEREQALDESNT